MPETTKVLQEKRPDAPHDPAWKTERAKNDLRRQSMWSTKHAEDGHDRAWSNRTLGSSDGERSVKFYDDPASDWPEFVNLFDSPSIYDDPVRPSIEKTAPDVEEQIHSYIDGSRRTEGRLSP